MRGYKVDRLTRSLADFAKIVDLLDAKGASFVSVTQAFNTTSIMGRLTNGRLWSQAPHLPFHGLQEVAEPRLFRAFTTVLYFCTRDLGLCGAAYRTRTCDPRITNAMLYQLS